MTLVHLTATAWCQACDWTTEGEPKTVDKAAEKHTKTPGHPTACSSRPEVKS